MPSQKVGRKYTKELKSPWYPINTGNFYEKEEVERKGKDGKIKRKELTALE